MLQLSGSDVGFCGSNLALGLPVPCRKPIAKRDFGLLGTFTYAKSETPNYANRGLWRCEAKQPVSKGTGTVQSGNKKPQTPKKLQATSKPRAPKKRKVTRKKWWQRSRKHSPGKRTRRHSIWGRRRRRYSNRMSTRLHEAARINRLVSESTRQTQSSSGSFYSIPFHGGSHPLPVTSRFYLQPVRVSPELVIEVYPVLTLSQNLCGISNPYLSACFLACCDST